MCLLCRPTPTKEQLVVSAVPSAAAYYPPLDCLVCPRRPSVRLSSQQDGVYTPEKLSDNLSEEEEGFDSTHKTGQCTEDQLRETNRNDSKRLELCTGLKPVLPHLSCYKTREGKICNDSGFTEIICTGSLPMPGSTAPQEQDPSIRPSELPNGKDLSASGHSSECDSQTNNDSGILLHGHQFSQEQSKPLRLPVTSRRDASSHVPESKKHSRLQQELTDILPHDHQNEFVVTSLEPRLHKAAPIEKLVVVKQRPLEVLGFCPEDEIVMTASLPIPQSLTTHKADIDRRHSDIRFFSCNMPTD